MGIAQFYVYIVWRPIHHVSLMNHRIHTIGYRTFVASRIHISTRQSHGSLNSLLEFVIFSSRLERLFRLRCLLHLSQNLVVVGSGLINSLSHQPKHFTFLFLSFMIHHMLFDWPTSRLFWLSGIICFTFDLQYLIQNNQR